MGEREKNMEYLRRKKEKRKSGKKKRGEIKSN
jgi:hypothetical protein